MAAFVLPRLAVSLISPSLLLTHFTFSFTFNICIYYSFRCFFFHWNMFPCFYLQLYFLSDFVIPPFYCFYLFWSSAIFNIESLIAILYIQECTDKISRFLTKHHLQQKKIEPASIHQENILQDFGVYNSPCTIRQVVYIEQIVRCVSMRLKDTSTT